MKIVITLDIPEGVHATVAESVPPPLPLRAEPEYTPPFADELIPLPPEAIPVQGDPVVRGMAHNPGDANCPVHLVPWKLVPAGVSKSSGKPYGAFWGCSGPRGCTQRPNPAFLASHPAA